MSGSFTGSFLSGVSIRGRKKIEKLTPQGPADYLGPTGVLRHFKNSRGTLLAAYLWPASTPEVRGIVHLVHGHGSHIVFEFLKFQGLGLPQSYAGSWVEQLNLNGYSVTGIDFQGCGRSDGLRCFIERFEHHVDDVVALAEWQSTWGIPKFDAGLKRMLLGESMGGCVSVLAAMRRPDLFMGTILLAPMLSLDRLSQKGINRVLLPVAGAVSYWMPTLPVAKVNPNLVFPELQEAYEHDPWTYKGNTRARNAYEYLTTTQQLTPRLPEIKFPFLVFHCEDDFQVDVEGSKRLYARAQSEDKTLRLMDRTGHYLVKEAGNEDIFDELLTWLERRFCPEEDLLPVRTRTGSYLVAAQAAQHHVAFKNYLASHAAAHGETVAEFEEPERIEEEAAEFDDPADDPKEGVSTKKASPAGPTGGVATKAAKAVKDLAGRVPAAVSAGRSGATGVLSGGS